MLQLTPLPLPFKHLLASTNVVKTAFGPEPLLDAKVAGAPKSTAAAATPRPLAPTTALTLNHFLIASPLPQGAGRVLCRTQQIGRQFQIRPDGSPDPQTRMGRRERALPARPLRS